MSERGNNKIFMGKLCENENSLNIQVLSSTLGRLQVYPEKEKKRGLGGVEERGVMERKPD